MYQIYNDKGQIGKYYQGFLNHSAAPQKEQELQIPQGAS